MYIDPYYATYPGTIRGAGAEAVAIPARAERGFQPDPADIAAAADGARSLLINSPNNPTGVVYTRTRWRRLPTSWEPDLWVISDEVYDTQLWDGEHLVPRHLPGMADRTLVVGSLSKSHAMTGSRLGWLVGPEDASKPSSTCRPTRPMACRAIFRTQDCSPCSRGTDSKTGSARRSGGGIAWSLGPLQRGACMSCPSTAAMYLMVDIRPTGLSGEAFAHRLLDNHRIAVMPGESFGAAAAGHLRVALTVDDDRLMAAVATLADVVGALAAAAA